MVLIVRKEQLFLLSRQHRLEFERRLSAHLGQFFPAACKAIGPDKLHDAILEGIDRAHQHGLVGERAVTKFFNVLFTFGRHCDGDPRYPWIARILESDQPERVKIGLLYEAAIEHESEGRGYFARPPELA